MYETMYLTSTFFESLNMSIKLIKGDCLDKLNLLPDKSVDLTLTDIPYSVVNRPSNGLRNLDKGKADGATIDLHALTEQLCRVTKGSIYIFCSTEQVSSLRSSLIDKKLTTRLCIWEKTNPSPMNGQYVWLSGVECCVFGKFPKATFNEHCKNSVWRFPSAKGKLHPTMKPVSLMEYIISVSSNEDDTILDPFMGSGSTIIAAINLNRKAIGIELDPEFYAIAKNRIYQTIGGQNGSEYTVHSHKRQ